MNRYKIIFIFMLTGLAKCLTITCQTIQQLKPNAVPAYVILGVSPSNIERPTTPKEFATAMNNAVAEDKLAPNFALEVNPWQMLSKNKNISYANKVINTLFAEPALKSNVRDNFNISIATSASDTSFVGRLKKGTSAGIGLKTIIINGKARKATVKALLGLNAQFNNEVVIDDLFDLIDMLNASNFTKVKLAELVTNVKNAHDLYEDGLGLNDTLTSARKEQKHSELDRLESHINDIVDWSKDSPPTRINKAKTYLQKKRTELINIETKLVTSANRKIAFAREGFILDVNLAYMAHFPNSDYDAWHYAKFAAWTTMSFRCNLDQTYEDVNLFDIMFLLRFTANDMKVDSSNYTDLGLKLQYTYNKFTASGEFIGRYLNQKPASVRSDYTYRLTGSLEYAFTSTVTLKLAIGRNFDGNSVTYDKPNDKIFAVAGLNFSILKGQ